MGRRGPKPIVERILEEIKDMKDDEKQYLVVYFTGRKTPRDFYRHINRLEQMELIEKVGRNIILCKGEKAFKITMILMEKYSFKTKVFEVIPAERYKKISEKVDAISDLVQRMGKEMFELETILIYDRDLLWGLDALIEKLKTNVTELKQLL